MDYDELYARPINNNEDAQRALADFFTNIPLYFTEIFTEIRTLTYPTSSYHNAYNQTTENQYLASILLKDKMGNKGFDLFCEKNDIIIRKNKWSVAPKRSHTIVRHSGGGPYAFYLTEYLDWFKKYPNFGIMDNKGSEIIDPTTLESLHDMNDVMEKFFIMKEFTPTEPESLIQLLYTKYIAHPINTRIITPSSTSYSDIWEPMHFLYVSSDSTLKLPEHHISASNVLMKDALNEMLICYVRREREDYEAKKGLEFNCVGKLDLLPAFWNMIKPTLIRDFSNARLADAKHYAIKAIGDTELIHKMDKVL